MNSFLHKKTNPAKAILTLILQVLITINWCNEGQISPHSVELELLRYSKLGNLELLWPIYLPIFPSLKKRWFMKQISFEREGEVLTYCYPNVSITLTLHYITFWSLINSGEKLSFSSKVFAHKTWTMQKTCKNNHGDFDITHTMQKQCELPL